MSRNRFMLVIGLLVVASMIFAACVPPVVEETPVVTAEPTPPPVTRTGAWVDQIVFTGIDQAEAAVTQLQAGEIDIYAYGVSDAVLFETVKADPNLSYTTAFGSYTELTFNPYGPEFLDGRLNPFSVRKIREAVNMLVDRDYIAQEIYGGLAIPKFTSLNANFPDYARYVDTARAIEAKYAYNMEAANAIITEEMTTLGAEMVDGKWNYNGAPIVIIGIIRVEDNRTQIGDYFANQLEAIGFTVDRQYKTRSEASPIWNRGNPEEGLMHYYTGGWITTAISRDDATNFGYFYTPLGGTSALWTHYVPTEEYLDLATRLWINDFTTMEERGEMFAQAMLLANEDSVRVWLIDQISFSPQVANLQVTYDLAGGVAGAVIYPYTIRFAGQEGGVVRWAQPGVLIEPWNPIAGSNWIYDTSVFRATTDWATMPDPYTGLAWPQRIAGATITAQTGLPISKTLDWINLEFADEIAVPADAWADWDAVTQTFIPAGDGVTAMIKSSVTYPADLFTTMAWHDGSPLSAGDFVMAMIMQFDPAKPESAIYDEAQVPNLEAFLSYFKGVKIVSTDPLVIETYVDFPFLDAESAVYGWYPNYAQGTASWHALSLGIQAEADGRMTFTADKADLLGVEWMSYISGPSMEIFEEYVAANLAAPVIPYAPTLGQFVTAEEAAARYANIDAWYTARHHFWVGTGPFYLESVFPIEGSVTLARNENYPDAADKWARFTAPKIAVVDLTGPASVTIGQDATFDVFVTYEDAPYPQAEITGVKFLLFDATNNLVATGEATFVADGQYQVVLPTTGLAAGSNKLEVAVTSVVVSIPSFQSFEFVTTTP
jgi:peptide/nickel transport system substrate-binding protein